MKNYPINIVSLLLGLFSVLMTSKNIAQVNLTESHLPIFIIDTDHQFINDSIKITADLKVYFNQQDTLNNIHNSAPHYDGKIGLEYRGSSSLEFPKKSFNIETRDEVGENLDFPLLGFPSENDWILYAPYSDKSLMRNVLAHYLFAKLGHYSPRTMFCEVILNGSYQGVYVFMEKIKRDKERVNITKHEDTQGINDDVTGGYILQIDRNDNSGWYSEIPPQNSITNKTYYQIIYPKNGIDSLKIGYIKNFITDYENIFLPQETDVFSLINKIDLESYIDFLLINELAKNVDAYRLSTFLFKDSDAVDGRLKFGPVWDFNIAFGNVDYYSGDREFSWQIYSTFIDAFMPPVWMRKIFMLPLVQNKFKDRWLQLSTSALAIDSINSFIDGQVADLGPAINRNFARWRILGVNIWPNPAVRFTYENEITYLKEWTQERVNWMQTQMNGSIQLVSWNNPVNIVSNNDRIALPHFQFYNFAAHIDSVKFVSFSNELTIENQVDSVYLHSLSSKIKNFIGIAYSGDVIIDVSPTYSIGGSVTSVEILSAVESFQLYQNYPNPFNPSTTIKYSVPQPVGVETQHAVSLQIYDILGRHVATLVNGQQAPGNYFVEWDASSLASGLYLYKLKAGDFKATKKMTIIK